MVTYSSLVVLTPIKQSPDHNIVRIHREIELNSETLLHVAGGNHTGIIINRLTELPPDGNSDVVLSFSVWLNGSGERRQEKRTMSFLLRDGVDLNSGRAVVHNFFKQLLLSLPKDYVTFMTRVLKLLQQDFSEIQRVELDLQLVKEEEQVAIPDAAQYDSGSEVEEVTVGHVQEVLEHAFPNGLTLAHISDALRCTEQEALDFLAELVSSGVATQVGDEWLRVDTRNVDAVARGGQNAGGSADQPTVAIITCLFVEKQAVDALIEDSSIVHKYKSGGDSNVYTMGRIGEHRVVATKLALIGDSREAITSAGSITTRLLGNFQRIEHVFVVGVGGSVPHCTDSRLHARLGDVIVSASRPDAYIYAHDLIVDRKTEAFAGFAVRRWNPTDHVIRNIIEEGAEQLRMDWNMLTSEAVNRLNATGEADFTAPPADTDVLALPVGGGNVVVVPHPNSDRKGAEIHLGSVGALASIKRQPAEGENEEETVGQLRERFSHEYGLRCIDVGFDSVVAAIVGSRIDSWALIRGVADYQHGQSRSSKLWQAHSAARAAALTRAIIEKLPAA